VANPSVQACDLPAAWASHEAWRILETHWHDDKQFQACLNAWNRDPLRPRMRHYVGLVATPTEGLTPGFHRLSFNDGQVLLTLCVGELKPMLRAQDFRADSIFLSEWQSPAWDDWTVQALLRCCRRGTQLAASDADVNLQQQLTRHGFDIQFGAAPKLVQARYNPRWQIKSTRRQPASPIQPSNCVVIGAGLAGASTAASLARRGWQVKVLEASAAPAGGASGLPLGLMAAPAASEHNLRAHLLRQGVGLTLAQAREHLKIGHDWAPSGIMTTQPEHAAYWEPNAAWIKPHRLVQTWLAQPGVQFQGNARVASMDQSGTAWILRDAQDKLLAKANLVVLACPDGVQTLLAGRDGSGLALRQPMAAIHGQLSWALQQESDQTSLPPFPLNGVGHLVPDVPVESGSAWFAGATYAVDDAMPAAAQGHDANLSRLAQLHAPSAQVMAQRMRDGSIQAWQGTRFTTQDRMPLVGRLYSSASDDGSAMLCINSGYGSRGLSWSVLCAELLAAQLHGEPLPMPSAWAGLLRGSP
jgi:tRNA 5-methylaminomethyl-2-thiouridine biosynthesis bifunctional protein